MIPVAGFVLGFITGVMRARKGGGNTLDQLQYGAGFGIAFALLALFLGIMAVRTGLI